MKQLLVAFSLLGLVFFYNIDTKEIRSGTIEGDENYFCVMKPSTGLSIVYQLVPVAINKPSEKEKEKKDGSTN